MSVQQGSLGRVLGRTFSVLSSREFLAWLIGGWILIYVSSMIWTKESFTYFMEALRSNFLAQIPFVLFLVSGYLNLIKISAPVFKHSPIRSMMTALLPFGILLFFTGFFISAATRSFEWLVVRAGDVAQPRWSTEAYQIETIIPGVTDKFLDIDIESGRGLFKYEPKVRVRDKEARIFEIGAFPPTKVHDTYFHILNFGLAPNLTISENAVLQGQEYVPLRILGPGSVDTFEIQPLPYKFMLSLEPEKTIQKGSVKASEYNIRSPLYRVRVLEGEKVIADAVTKEGVRFGNFVMGFHEPGFWVQLETVKDHGVPFILAGIFLTVAGIPLFIAGLMLRHIKKPLVRGGL